MVATHGCRRRLHLNRYVEPLRWLHTYCGNCYISKHNKRVDLCLSKHFTDSWQLSVESSQTLLLVYSIVYKTWAINQGHENTRMPISIKWSVDVFFGGGGFRVRGMFSFFLLAMQKHCIPLKCLYIRPIMSALSAVQYPVKQKSTRLWVSICFFLL